MALLLPEIPAIIEETDEIQNGDERMGMFNKKLKPILAVMGGFLTSSMEL